MTVTEFRRAAIIFAPLVLVAAGIIYLLYRAEVSAAWSILQAEQRDLVELGRRRIIVNLEPAVSDVMYLAGQEALRQWLSAKDPAALRNLEAEYLAFSANKIVYDIVRFLDLEGHEVVRVDRNGKPRLIPDGELQDRKGRYFVPETLKLGKGQAYVSPFDLNFKNGVIEQPVKPVIRFGAPVFDAEGRKQGMVLLNYRGARLLERTGALAEYGPGEFWLLNANGYWLLGPRSEDEWGFMYPERRTRTLAQAYPEAWKNIQGNAASGQFITGGDLFTFAFVSPSESDMSLASNEKPAVRIVSAESWILLSRVPAQAIAARTAAPRRNFMIAFGVAAALLTLVASLIARYQIARLTAEQQIRNSEARFRGLLDSAPDAVVVTNKEGEIVLVNAQAEQLYGHPRNRLTGQPVEILVPERFRGRHTGYRRGYVAEKPQVRSMGAGLDLYGLRADGTEFPVEISLSPVQTSDGVLIVSNSRDVTQRRESEQKIKELNERLAQDNEALRDSEARFRGLLDLAPDAVIISNKNDEIVFSNKQAEQLYGYGPGELAGRNVLTLNPERYRERNGGRPIYFETVRAKGLDSQFILTGMRSNGAEFPIEITFSCVESGQEILIFTDIRDITEQRETAKKLQQLNERLVRDNNELDVLNRELEAFSYSVSHDLRAPLRAIDGFSQALLEDYADRLDTSGQDYLSRVRKAAQRMGELIDDLLKLARITRAEINAGEVDLSALAEEILEQLQQGDPQRAAEIVVAPGMTVQGDPRLLRIAMENLLNNAWKFTAGKTPARIEFGQTERNGAPAYVVRDNGAGFDMAHAGKLFGAFQRLHDAGAYPGTGIGLATVQRIIHKHGGNVWAEAAPDQGAAFYFTL